MALFLTSLSSSWSTCTGTSGQQQHGSASPGNLGCCVAALYVCLVSTDLSVAPRRQWGLWDHAQTVAAR
jgi:hypothetical protein